jgi:hypothetical protein
MQIGRSSAALTMTGTASMSHDSKSLDADLARYGVIGMSQPVEVMSARFRRHRFGEHAHDGWSLGAVVSGAKDIAARSDSPVLLSHGDVYAIEPGRAHAGRAAVASGCEYVMIYVPDAEWRRQCAAHGMPAGWLAGNRIGDLALTARLQAFVAMALKYPGRLETWTGEWQMFWEELSRAWGGLERGVEVRKTAPDWRTTPAMFRSKR